MAICHVVDMIHCHTRLYTSSDMLCGNLDSRCLATQYGHKSRDHSCGRGSRDPVPHWVASHLLYQPHKMSPLSVKLTSRVIYHMTYNNGCGSHDILPYQVDSIFLMISHPPSLLIAISKSSSISTEHVITGMCPTIQYAICHMIWNNGHRSYNITILSSWTHTSSDIFYVNLEWI